MQIIGAFIVGGVIGFLAGALVYRHNVSAVAKAEAKAKKVKDALK